jgi:hypothetical protein
MSCLARTSILLYQHLLGGAQLTGCCIQLISAAMPATLVQVEFHSTALGVRQLEGLSSTASTEDVCAFTESVVAMALDPSQHIALTPALALQRRNAEVRRRWAKYTLCAALGVGAVVIAATVVAHRSRSSKPVEGRPGPSDTSKPATSAGMESGSSSTAASDLGQWWSQGR